MIVIMLLLSMFVQETATQEKDFIPYKEAYALHEKSKRPVVMVITQPGCIPCATMKRSLLQFKKDYPNVILTEVSLLDAKRLYPKDQQDPRTRFDSTPITIMHAYDNDIEKVIRFRSIRGVMSKSAIYKYWEIE